MASTHVDSHQEKLTKEALKKMAAAINCTDKMIRVGVDHRRDFPPRGRLENAEVIEKEGENYLVADFREVEKTETVAWNEELIMQYFDTPFQFAEVKKEENSVTSISIDPHNFNSYSEVETFTNHLKSGDSLDFSIYFHGRKAAIPDPEIIFRFANTIFLYQLLKPTLKKIGEKIADEIADKAFEESKKVLSFIGNTLKETFYRCIPKTRPVTVVFDFPGEPHVELIARTRDEKVVLKRVERKQTYRSKK